MATIIDCFGTDFKYMSIHKDWEVSDDQGKSLPSIIARIHQAFKANAKFWSFLIPHGVNVETYINTIFQCKATKICVLDDAGDSHEARMSFSDYGGVMSSLTLLFSNRIFLYIDDEVDANRRGEITTFGEKMGFYVVVRDREYARKRSELEKPLAFISHDSRDKDDLVRELVNELSNLQCPVWYDEYSLEVGDSLRQNIERGLKETRKCVIILSPNFLSNEGWGKAEFDSIYTREIIEKQNVMLPVWHNVDVNQVYDYSPRLADKVGLPSSLGVKELARKLANKIKKPNANP